MDAIKPALMSVDAGIRLERLRTLFSRPIEMRERTGRSASFCSDLLNGRKSFGEKLARDMEEELKLPRGWFDQSDQAAPKPELDEEAELLAAFRALVGDPVARAKVLAYAAGVSSSAGSKLGELSSQESQSDPLKKSAA
jgi:hypothetical protein